MDVLDQDEFWISEGEKVPIEDLPIDHARNIIASLENNPLLHLINYQQRALQHPLAPSGEIASWDFERYLDEEFERYQDEPMEWVASLPAYIKLKQIDDDYNSRPNTPEEWWG